MSTKFNQHLLLAGITALILGLLVLVVPESSYDNKDALNQIEKGVAGEIDKVRMALEYLEPDLSTKPIMDIDVHDFGAEYVYVFKDGKPLLWSENKILPNFEDITKRTDGIVYFEKSGWKVLSMVREVESESGLLVLVGLVPLVYDPAISNKYLQLRTNEDIFFNNQFFIKKELSNGFAEVTYEDDFIFAIELGSSYKPTHALSKNIALALLFIGFFMIASVLIKRVRGKLDEEQYLSGFIYLVAFWLFVFLIFKGTANLGLWGRISFLDSRIYASSWLLTNLLDLIFFSLLLLSFAAYLSRLSFKLSHSKTLLKLHAGFRIIFSLVAVALLLYVLTMQFLIIRDIYDNSILSLDVNHSLVFSKERIACLFVFVITSLSVFLFFHTFLSVWLFFTNSKPLEMLVSLGLGVGLFVLVENNFPVVFLVSTLLVYLTLLYVSRIYIHFGEFNYLSLLYVAGSLILSSIIGAYSINLFEQKRDVRILTEFGKEQLIDEDVFGEFLMNESRQRIEEDVFISNWMSSSFVSKDIITRKIRQVYLDPYLDRYDIQIFLFNRAGQPLSNQVALLDYNTIFNRVSNAEDITDFENIYMKKRFRANMFKRYYTFVEIYRFNSRVGSIIIDFDQKRESPDNVYPELLIDSRIVQPQKGMDINYAVFSGSNLINSIGDFNYKNDFPIETLQDEDIFRQGKLINDKLHVALHVSPSRVVVLSSHSHHTKELLSNFSFLFLVLILFMGIALSGFLSSRGKKSPIRGFASRIQFYLNLAFILPLLLVSITTLSLLSSQSRREIEEAYRQKASDIAKNIQRELDNFQVNPSEGKDVLSEKLQNSTSLLNTDADLYNLSGGLITSTQPKIFDLGLLSKYLSPEARRQLIGNASNFYMEESQVGDLSYNVTYIPVKTLNTGKMIGILSLPFFDFRSILETQQIGVLRNILNIFSLLFITLLIISYFASQRLVDPLKMIARKLTGTSFTGYNAPIEWHQQDEIGLLVREYNRMIQNLEESKEVLTRTQKELVWREIAKQVAHEIKNPLTPMKLTLQQLQRRFTGNETLPTEDMVRPVNTLLRQVDILSDIATSFSTFAKMPIPEMKKFDLVELLSQTFNLHKNEKKVSVRFETEQEHILVLGDIKLMGRITTNIILNAIQSSNGSPITIDGKVGIEGNKAIISIRDDGPGIDEIIRDKVFLPSFSTKSEGSGIGLAIAKHGIEQSGGQIWFETKTGEGTTFYIELPLAEE